MNYWVKKKIAPWKQLQQIWAEEETGAKITRKMQKDKTGVNGADPAENQTPSYSAEVELEGIKWTPGHIFMLYYAVLAVFASGDYGSSKRPCIIIIFLSCFLVITT